MHAAAARGHADVVALLLEAGAKKFMNPNPIDGVPSVWEAAKDNPAVMQVLKAHRARKNWSKARSTDSMKKVKALSIYWYWLERAARRHTAPDPEGVAFMHTE
eukprot:3540541-Prymnesium_polylepis.1